MGWTYRFDQRALKVLRKLDRQAQKDVLDYLDKKVVGTGDPRRLGKGLRANLMGLWRCRVGDYRILCQVQEGVLIVLVVSVSHRRNVYG